VLGQLPPIVDPNVLVGRDYADDAGVYRLTDDLAAVLTADYFTPIVDSPYFFGVIAAANALSDVWAMGARAVCALNLAGFPGEAEFRNSLAEVVRGGSEKMAEAGVSVIGGHTIKDKEPKFGYAVLGLVHPEKILDNSMARAGDAIVLTKPIGTGIISTAIRRGIAGTGAEEEITRAMAALNKRPSEIMVERGASTATDVTGFGLIGHMWEVLSASGLEALIHSKRVPYFTGAVEFTKKNVVPGGTLANFRSFSRHVVFTEGVSEAEKILLNDAQTSGGLLIFVQPDKKDALVSALEGEGFLAAHIGDTAQGEPGAGRITVEP
jgi:selenide,water dikinase